MNKVKTVISVNLILSLLSISHSSCQQPNRKTHRELYLYTDESEIYYNLEEHNTKYFLPYVLEEVSGLTTYSDHEVFMIEDEGGKAYLYDLEQRELTRRIAFSKPGDFEGVEMVDDDIYITKSNGNLYTFPIDESDRVEPNKIKTPFDKDNDIEGLGYDPEKKVLLIATKASGDIDNHKVKGRAIYHYDPEKDNFIKKSSLEINSHMIMDFLSDKKDIDYDKDQLIGFKPSGIAFHPIEKVYYIISAHDRFMIVMTPNGTIKATYPIRSSQLIQPEGICFLANGDLLISSEGQGEKGYILQYEMLTK